jgi:phosphoribosyl-ATP pyrophosphohydrolase
MLTAQEAFQRLMDVHGRAPSELTGDERKDYIRTHVLATTDELHEALRETAWKPWSQKTDEYTHNRVYFVEELIDAWHHLMNLMLVADISADEFFNEYRRKMEINKNRKNNGYISTTG